MLQCGELCSFSQANNLIGPARPGDFAAPTRIINGPRECNGGSGAVSEQTRVATYLQVRLYFNLGASTSNTTNLPLYLDCFSCLHSPLSYPRTSVRYSSSCAFSILFKMYFK